MNLRTNNISTEYYQMPIGYLDSKNYRFYQVVSTYDQIKDKFWEPGLLNKLIDQTELNNKKENNSLELYPEIQLELENSK